MAVLVLPYVFLYDKNVSLMFINSHHSPDLDLILYHITRLPEVSMIVFVVFLSAFYERRIFLAVVVSMSLCGILILLSKNILFPDHLRPFQWLNSNKIPFHHVEGIRLHSNGSFPSGHSMAAFCSLALAGFISRSGIVQFLLFLLACVSAYSRVYVAQHYLQDIYTGALIGFFLAWILFTCFQVWFKTPYWQRSFLKRKSA